MRSAYSGRAAAYAKNQDFERALRDHNMVVLLYGVEAEILSEVESPNRAAFLHQATEAFLQRSNCLRALGRLDAARKDLTRASKLYFEAQELAAKATEPTPKGPPKSEASPRPGWIHLINAWSVPITVVVDGVPHRLDVAEQKTINHKAGAFTCGLQGRKAQTVTLEAGKSVTVWYGIR
jgi:hypothetical protein